MEALQGKTAVVVGGTSGVGKATVKALIGEGARVTAVARGADGLERLSSEFKSGLETVRADASEATFADRLLPEIQPDLVVVAAGAVPHLAPLDEQTWESFSATWNADTKTAFRFVKAALRTPLRPGSTVVIVSSGAAIKGSPLSGGYAGAKRMQWLLVQYAQAVADAKRLGIRFLAVLPAQFIAGTTIGAAASEAYGARQGISGAEVMRRFDAPLDAEKVAAAIVGALRGSIRAGVTAISVSGKGTEDVG